MSPTDVTSSTLSTIINSIFVVVNEGNSSSSSSISSSSIPNSDGNGYNNFFGSNTTTTPSTLIPHSSKGTYADQAVAHGVSQGKVIAVMTMLIIFSIFGSLGNGLVLYVFSKKSDKVTSTIFILALAWTDFFMCLIFMPFTVAFIHLNSRIYLDFFCKLYQFLNTSSVPLSAFIMVAIAVDRYFSICHPFVHVVTPRRARITIICLLLVAFTLGSITACLYGVRNSTNTTEASNNGSGNMCYNETRVTETSPLFTDRNMEIFINSSYSFRRCDGSRADPESVHSSAQSLPSASEPENTEGLCGLNNLTLSDKFTQTYQKVYISFYIISLLAVFTLYFFIYRSVAERRAWRRKQKSWSHSPMTMTAAVTTIDNGKSCNDIYTGEGVNLELAPQSISFDASHSDSKESGDFTENARQNTATSASSKTTSETVKNNCAHENGGDNFMLSASDEKKTNRERRDFNFLANIRTAIMLFVVTLVFIVSFLPAWLMATELIAYEIIIFYMHFVYNVANPVIYAFMNQSFRKELKRVFQRDCGLNCCKRRHRLSSDRTFSRTGMTAVSICDSPNDAKGHNPIYKSPSSDS